MASGKSFCFTLNNYTEEEYNTLLKYFEKATYYVIGKEVGKQGTPHLQGYVEFKNSVLFKTLNNLCKRTHWEIRRGTPVQASEYCKKDKEFIEAGVLKQQGKRNDLEQIAVEIDDGSNLKEIAREYPSQFMKFHKGIEKYILLKYEDRVDPPEVHWRWGDTGTGKTRFVYDTYGAENIYSKDESPWWDGYTQQKVIIIDDFEGKFPFRDLLKLLDRYPYQGQVKGGYVKINSPIIYITSDRHPNSYYNLFDYPQLERRIKTITHLTAEAAEVAGNTNGH